MGIAEQGPPKVVVFAQEQGHLLSNADIIDLTRDLFKENGNQPFGHSYSDEYSKYPLKF